MLFQYYYLVFMMKMLRVILDQIILQKRKKGLYHQGDEWFDITARVQCAFNLFFALFWFQIQQKKERKTHHLHYGDKKAWKIKKKKSFDWCRNYQNSKYTSNQDFSKDKSCQWKDQILFFKQQITEGLYFMCCMQSLLLQKVSYQF